MNYSFKIVEPFDANEGKFNSLHGCTNAIFLAGPCPRSNFNEDWRLDAFDILDEIGFTGTVLTPTNPNFKAMASKFNMSTDESRQKQVAWERAADGLPKRF